MLCVELPGRDLRVAEFVKALLLEADREGIDGSPPQTAHHPDDRAAVRAPAQVRAHVRKILLPAVGSHRLLNRLFQLPAQDLFARFAPDAVPHIPITFGTA